MTSNDKTSLSRLSLVITKCITSSVILAILIGNALTVLVHFLMRVSEETRLMAEGTTCLLGGRINEVRPAAEQSGIMHRKTALHRGEYRMDF